MRYAITTTDRPLRLAKALRAALKARDVHFTLSKCQALVSRMLGYRDWHKLGASADPRSKPGPDDGEAGPDVAGERRRRHVAILVESEVPEGVAREVTDAVHVTSSRPERTGPLPTGDSARPTYVTGTGGKGPSSWPGFPDATKATYPAIGSDSRVRKGTTEWIARLRQADPEGFAEAERIEAGLREYRKDEGNPGIP